LISLALVLGGLPHSLLGWQGKTGPLSREMVSRDPAGTAHRSWQRSARHYLSLNHDEPGRRYSL